MDIAACTFRLPHRAPSVTATSPGTFPQQRDLRGSCRLATTPPMGGRFGPPSEPTAIRSTQSTNQRACCVHAWRLTHQILLDRSAKLAVPEASGCTTTKRTQENFEVSVGAHPTCAGTSSDGEPCSHPLNLDRLACLNTKPAVPPCICPSPSLTRSTIPTARVAVPHEHATKEEPQRQHRRDASSSVRLHLRRRHHLCRTRCLEHRYAVLLFFKHRLIQENI